MSLRYMRPPLERAGDKESTLFQDDFPVARCPSASPPPLNKDLYTSAALEEDFFTFPPPLPFALLPLFLTSAGAAPAEGGGVHHLGSSLSCITGSIRFFRSGEPGGDEYQPRDDDDEGDNDGEAEDESVGAI